MEEEKPEKNKGGRPPGPVKEYDQKVFEGLCNIHCTVDEIESVLKSDQRTISKWCERVYGKSFQDVYQDFKRGGKASLRRKQMNLATKNASMAIWLGKQLLGQREIPVEFEQFNGKLSILLDTLKTIQSEKDLKDNKMQKLEEEVKKEEENTSESV